MARIGRDELLATAGIGEQELKEWESYGLLVPLPDGAYDAEAVTVASLVVQLGRFGIEPRHLRVMKAAADREAGLVDRGGSAEAPPQPSDQGTRGSPHQGAGGTRGETARGAGADRSGRAAALKRAGRGPGSPTRSRPDYPNVPGTA